MSNIEDAVNDKVVTSFSSTGEINKGKLLGKLKEIPGVSELPADASYTFPLLFKVNEYYAKVDVLGNVEVSIEKPPMPVYASEDTSYVGYYADLDGNANNGPEGIIYADLAVGSSLAFGPEDEYYGNRKWNNHDFSIYEYEAVKSGLKKYTVGSEDVSGFGTWEKPMITEASGEGSTKRFYVMALEDLDDSYHYWWEGGYGKLDNSKNVNAETNDFGTGITNTNYWIGKYDDESYRNKQEITESIESYTDLWQMERLRSKVSEGWFVPSKSEWSAFGDMCYKLIGMTNSKESYFQTFGLYYRLWSSSIQDAWCWFSAGFVGGYIERDGEGMRQHVRLSTTF